MRKGARQTSSAGLQSSPALGADSANAIAPSIDPSPCGSTVISPRGNATIFFSVNAKTAV
jgi:hypothetical protein